MKICKNELMYQVAFALDCVERDLIGVATGHGKRVAAVSMEIGRALGMTQEQVGDLAVCAVLHDNALTEYIREERMGGSSGKNPAVNLGTHCIMGENNAAAFPFTTDVTGYIQYHHEEADGSGPFGKKQDEIPLGAAIIHIADQMDVLFDLEECNPEKLEKINGYLREKSGLRFGKDVTGAFMDICNCNRLNELSPDRIDSTLRSFTCGVGTQLTQQQIMDMGRVFAQIIDYKSHFTQTHSSGIAEKTARMADYYRLPQEERAELVLAAYLHDVGKLAVPLEILEKPGRLTGEEYEQIKLHAKYTYDMLSGVSGMERVCAWGASHHEKLDGSGYPFGKDGSQLDRNSRMLGCIDIYQALTEERPYRQAMSHRQVMELMTGMVESGKIDGDILRDMDRVLA